MFDASTRFVISVPISKLTLLNAVVFPLVAGGLCPHTGGGGDSIEATDGDGLVPCVRGEPGCPCSTEGECNRGLECLPLLGRCVFRDGCPTGEGGCECTMQRACEEGFICMESFCVSEMPCFAEETGVEGCQCTADLACDPDLTCVAELCTSAEGDEGSSSES